MLAGGGGGCISETGGGGGGAGGYRDFRAGAAYRSCVLQNAPLGACVSALPVSVTAFPITVGGGGAAGAPGPEFTRWCLSSQGTSGSQFNFFNNNIYYWRWRWRLLVQVLHQAWNGLSGGSGGGGARVNV